jgi:carboxyl-terminal processing protease
MSGRFRCAPWICAAASLRIAAAWAAPGNRERLEPDPFYAQIARQFARTLPASHLLQTPLNDAIAARAWTNFLGMLDYDRAYLLRADIAEFEARRPALADALKAGDVSFAFDAFHVFKQRLDDRCRFVTNLLAGPIDFTVPENYAWRRKDAPWPTNAAAQDELWRLRLKNEYLAYAVARELQPPAATNGAAHNSGTNGYTNAPPPPTPEEFVRRRYRQFQIVIHDSDADWLLQRYLGAFAAAYDPHSMYMPPAAVEDFNIDMNLSLGGIGALLSPEDGAARVQEIIPGGPADRDRREIRLRPGDKIIGVGQNREPIEDVLHLPLSQTVRKIRGPKGTRVVLHLINGSDPSGMTTRYVDLVRDDVKLEEQAATGRVERVVLTNGASRALGIVRLPAFYGSVNQRPGDDGFRSSATDVARCLAELNDAGVEGLVLDLRNNGGGSLREAILLTGLFIRSGPVVQVREVSQIQVLPDRDPAVAFRRPMVVLVNRISASASEIVAGALQDYGRAIILGDSATHGKGSVQTILALGDDKRMGSIKVTAASYYRVTGASTQLRGVVPDIVLPSVFDHLDLGEDKLPNAMPWSRVPPADFVPLSDLQTLLPGLRAASEARRGANPRFGRHLRLVEHVRELNARTALPLEREARRAQARAEREMRRAEESADDETRPDGDDVTLDEALHVLSDLVDLTGRQDLFPEEPAGDGRILDLMRRIFSP